MFDICEGPSTPRNTHYLLPLSRRTAVPPEEKSYLNSLGALDLPDKDVCSSLLRCYFRNVHQLLPIIDTQEVLANYLGPGPENMSLLLLWSIFFASSNFVESDILERAGFRSRKVMKRNFYRRAKALYDCDYEKDKLTLIQSVILLGLWYNDTNDRNGAWHWIGIAISLSQSIGLHRRLRLAVPSNPIPERREKLYRRIWWTCFVRDRWLSLANGQPMRIRTSECDLPAPSVSDITDEIETMDPATRCKYIPWEPTALARLWLRLVHISQALGSILERHNKVNESRPGVTEIQSCEQEIALCSMDSAELEYTDPMMRLFASQLQLLYEATTVVLYRPYIFKGPVDSDEAVTKLWQQKSLDRARSAAANTTRVLEGLLETSSIKNLKSMTITALIPAMQIHLLDCKSSNALVRQFASQKLQICMLALSELRDTYWGADFVFEIFQRAQSKLLNKFVNPLQQGRLPEVTSVQTSREPGTMQEMPPLNNVDTSGFNRCMSPDNGFEDRSNPHSVNTGSSRLVLIADELRYSLTNRRYFSDEVDFDHSFQFLLDSNDFSDLFLNMVYS
ncbi:fungal-specific transcription factor domain-containing protein [Mariannaea sp. PMI_226]|nr:fungal-specific transcription factor domain-containing protein [Mariannaea sp. PMI_226]